MVLFVLFDLFGFVVLLKLCVFGVYVVILMVIIGVVVSMVLRC